MGGGGEVSVMEGWALGFAAGALGSSQLKRENRGMKMSMATV